MKAILVLSAALLLIASACGGSSSSNTSSVVAPAPPVAPDYVYAGTVRRDLSITSAGTGVTYPYHVYLPPDYESSGKTYPVVYGTDAQWIFPFFSRTIDARRKGVIFVGIEEGPRGSDRRATDFQPAGATAYIGFLKTELIPLIERTYRASAERTYVGTSFGGLLGSVLLSKEQVGVPYFKNYLLFDGSFGRMLPSNIDDEVARFTASPSLPVTLVLTSANPGNFALVDAYQARYQGRGYTGLTIHRRSFNVPHNDVGDPSFSAAIDLIY